MAVVEARAKEAELGIARTIVVVVTSFASLPSCGLARPVEGRSMASTWGMVTPARMLTRSLPFRAFWMAGGLRQVARSLGWQARMMLSARPTPSRLSA